MKAHPTNPALEAAIIAHADEDTPRLAYADWLDENGDPDRAAFIRVQCRLADRSPAELEWVDLREQQDELVARLKLRYSELAVEVPDPFYTGSDFIDNHEEPFRRGFPHFIDCQADVIDWDNAQTKHIIKELTNLVRTSTIRGISFSDVPHEALAEMLTAQVAANLTGFAFFPYAATSDWRADFARACQILGTAPAVRQMKHLFLYGAGNALPSAELARAKTFDSVRRMTIQNIEGTKSALEKLTRTAWFRQLRHFRCHLDRPAVATSMLTGLGKLPDLHTLDLPEIAPGAVKALAAGKFPALARLMYGGPLAMKYAKTLAGAKFPALVAFEASGGSAKNDGLLALLDAAWFKQLSVLDLSECAIGDKALKALAAHPVAKTLRVLQIGDNPFGNGGLASFATPGAFPALTTLSLECHHTRKGKPAELAAWLTALQLPNLRYLNLEGWPLGNEGAKSLAANPAFANLTRLNLESCGIGDPGAQALFASPHLQNLVELELSYNNIKTGADALAKPTVMPRLGECRLSSNKIPQKAAKKLERDGLYLIT